ncbi:hypothetical protein BDW62DRAFT_191884 [Aspergillus aurantiobrunneus]
MFPILTVALGKVQELSVHLGHNYKGAAPDIALLAQLTELRYLDIRIDIVTATPPDAIAPLGSLSTLRALCFEARDVVSSPISGFDDTFFRSLVSGLVDLRRLRLYFVFGNLTTASLIAPAKYCPSLQSCEVACLDVDILDFRPCRVPLFPRLKELCIGRFVGTLWGKEFPAEHASILALYLPNLDYLSRVVTPFSRPCERFHHEVEIAWRKNRSAEGKQVRLYGRRSKEWLRRKISY